MQTKQIKHRGRDRWLGIDSPSHWNSKDSSETFLVVWCTSAPLNSSFWEPLLHKNMPCQALESHFKYLPRLQRTCAKKVRNSSGTWQIINFLAISSRGILKSLLPRGQVRAAMSGTKPIQCLSTHSDRRISMFRPPCRHPSHGGLPRFCPHMDAIPDVVSNTSLCITICSTDRKRESEILRERERRERERESSYQRAPPHV